jgi:hypothetical protein
MRQPTIPLLLAAALAAVSAPRAAAAEQPKAAAPKQAAAAPAADYTEKGIRFRLPGGFPVAEQQEAEQGADNDIVYVARKGGVEARVEVEDGPLDCKEILDAAPRHGKTAAGLERCEAEAMGPPALGDKVVDRHAAMVSVQFPGRHLSVIVFAPDKAVALALAREVAASAVLAKDGP